MQIKKTCKDSTSDFWYDLSKGGYLKPEEMLEKTEDVEKVKEAIAVLEEFEESCEDQIEEFYN